MLQRWIFIVSFGSSPNCLRLFHFSNLIHRDYLLFNQNSGTDMSSVIQRQLARRVPLAGGVNHKSYSKLWQRLCVHPSCQHVSPLITHHPALNICLLAAVASGAGKRGCLQMGTPLQPPHSCLLNTDGTFCNTPHDTELLMGSLPAVQQKGELYPAAQN